MTFEVLTVLHLILQILGPVILTQGTLSHQSHMSQQFPLFLASLVMPQTTIRLEWFGRGNILRYFNSYTFIPKSDGCKTLISLSSLYTIIPKSRVGHRILLRSERIVILRSFKARNVLLRFFLEFLETYETQKNDAFFCILLLRT